MNHTKTLRELLDLIEKQEEKTRLIERQIAALNNKDGQGLSKLSVNGVIFDVNTLDSESGWMPYTIKGMEHLVQSANAVLEVFLRRAKTNLEETRFKYIQLSKEI
jgi:hypothetical protein